MFSRSEMKFSARQCLSGNWGPAAVATLCILLVTFPLALAQQMTYDPSMQNLLSLLLILVEGPLMIAAAHFFLPLSRTATADINNFFQGFEQIGKSFLAGLWHFLWIFLWGLLLIVPGIIKILAYSQYFYILTENPQADLKQALKTSIKMTNGYKTELFLLELSFIGWYLAVIFTAGLAIFYVGPYINTTYCKIYDYLKQQALANGICTPEEFGISTANMITEEAIIQESSLPYQIEDAPIKETFYKETFHSEVQTADTASEGTDEGAIKSPDALLDRPTAIQQKEVTHKEPAAKPLTTTSTYICRLTKQEDRTTPEMKQVTPEDRQQAQQTEEQQGQS